MIIKKVLHIIAYCFLISSCCYCSLFYVNAAFAKSAVKTKPKNIFADFVHVKVSAIVEDLLRQDILLLSGGGRVFKKSGGWVGLGIGYADLDEGDNSTDVTKARKIARINATNALTGFINGVQVDYTAKHHEEYAENMGKAHSETWITNSIKEEIIGNLSFAQIAGEWQSNENELGIAVIVAYPPIDIALKSNVQSVDSNLSFFKSTIEKTWLDIIAHYPWILQGGVSICSYNDKLYILTVKKGILKGNPAYDSMQLPTIMDAKARREITQYIHGLKNNSLSIYEEKVYSSLDAAHISEQLSKITYENVSGVVSNIKLLGKWYSDDEKTLFQAFVVPLS